MTLENESNLNFVCDDLIIKPLMPGGNKKVTHT